MKKKLLSLIVVLLCSIGSWAQVEDVSSKLVASGTNWPTFSSEKTGNSDNKPKQGSNNVAEADVKGACTLSDFKFAEVYYDKKTGSKYTVSQEVTGLDNGIYKFRIAAFARKQNIWTEEGENGQSDANNVRLQANNSSTYITSNVMAYYELITEVTDGKLTISISGVDATNKSNWMGYTDASLVKLFSGSSYPADVTGLITNPSFDGGTNTGWTTTTSVNGNNQALNGTAWEYWSWTPGSGGFDYYQILTGVPNGRYTISAKMFNDQVQKEGDDFEAAAGIYATSGDVTVWKLVDVQGSSLNKYTTDEIVVTNGTLRIGAKNHPDKTMTARWFVMDEFELSYEGPVVESGTYYLYDSDNEVFASRGANYGTRMTVDKYGIPVKWDNWSQRLQFVDHNSYYLFFDNTPSASWIYTDREDVAKYYNYFAFCPATDGYYLKDNNQTAFVNHNGTGITTTTEQSSATVWSLKNSSEYNAIVGTYPADNKTAVITAASLTSETNAAGFEEWLAANRAAKDKTSSIGTAKFAGSVGDWTWNGTRENFSNSAINYGTDYAEAFQRSGDWSQTISELPNGLYKVTVNSFERASSYEICNTLGAAGYEPVTSYFEANGQKVQLKSWYSEKSGTSNPNTTGEAVTAFNSDKYKNEVYAYVSDGTLTLKLAKPSCMWSSWVLFNNVTLTYYDTNVSDGDATAILEEAVEQMGKPMLATLRSAISDAKDTFDANRTVPNYNALRAAIDASATSVESYLAMKNNYLDPMKAALDANKFHSSSAKSDYYDEYLTQYEEGTIANATAAAMNWKSGTRYEAPINNMLMDIWKIGNTTATTDDSGLYINSWSTENKGTGDAADFANPFYEYWVSSGSLPETTLTGKLTGLTANTAYSVTANVRVQGSSKIAGSITMEVVGGAPVDVTAGDAIMDGETLTGRYIKSYTVTGVTDGDGNLELKFNIAANSNINWLAFRDVTYATSEAAITNSFTTLNSAITTAEGYTLGFEEGEYAPYNNVSALKTLNAAKAINQSRYYVTSYLDDVATELSETSWSSNASKVNAFYDGTFASQAPKNDGTNGTKVTGWTDNSNIRTLPKSGNPEQALYKATDGHSGMYVWSGADATYGETAGYTVPLHANQVYSLSYKRGSWDNDNSSTYGSVTISGPNETAIPLVGESLYAYKYTSTEGDLAQQNLYFVAPYAGNYVFVFGCSGNTVFTDFQLYSVDSNTLTFKGDGTTPVYAAGTYPTVSLDRSFSTTKRSTMVLPFAMTEDETSAAFEEVYELSGVDGESIKFTPSSTITAGKPYLVKAKSAALSVTNKAVDPSTTVTNTEVEYVTFVGTFSPITLTSANSNAYIVSNNTLYNVNSDVSVPAYRGYFTVDTTSGVKNFVLSFDDETAIESIDDETMENAPIYNLAGQRVNKAQKGIYIVNGKKMLVK